MLDVETVEGGGDEITRTSAGCSGAHAPSPSEDTSQEIRPGEPVGPVERARRAVLVLLGGRSIGGLPLRLLSLAFVLVTILPVIRRLLHPTILTDDVIRLVYLIEHPLRDLLLFRPFNEHVAVFFDLVSWVTWQAIGHDLRLAPLGYTIASIIPWVIVLALFGYWLARETGSRTSSLIAVAMVAQSPLIMDTAWWYSASSFSWAIIGILLALLGASEITHRPRRSLVLIGLGTMLGPAGTSLGNLAMPLAILRGLVEPKASRHRKLLVLGAAIGGLTAYWGICHLGGIDLLGIARQDGTHMAYPLAGLGYALSVPGRVLWPSTLGVPASWCANSMPSWLGWGIGIVLLLGLATTTVWPRGVWSRRTVLVGAGMIYLGYGLIYTARAGLVKEGRWTEPQLIYLYAARYHVLPLLGLTAVFAALLSAWRPIRRCDTRPGLPALVGTVVGLVMLVIQHHEASNPYLTFLLHQPDQKATMAALHRLGQVARLEGITRAQLQRLVPPALRGWNEAILGGRESAFSMMKLVDAPDQVDHPRSDDEVRSLLRARLTPAERIAVGSGACASFSPGQPNADARTLAVARRLELNQVREDKPGQYRSDVSVGYIRFEFDPTPEARFLVLPGLRADQNLMINCSDPRGRWRPGRYFQWLKSPKSDSPAVIDLESMIHIWGEPITQFTIRFTRPGEIALQGYPRLLR